MSLRRSRARWSPLLLLASAVVAACGPGRGVGTGGVTGAVRVSGSSTVEPISSAAAEVFVEENPRARPSVEGPGTGDGFKLFCSGDIDIADASRPIKDEEAQRCADEGIEYIELKIGFDGIAVLTSPENDVDCLSFADLYALIGPESQGFDEWSDARPLARELGSRTHLPDRPLDLTGPGEESGTYDSFIEIAFADIAEQRVEAGAITEEEAETTRPDYQASANDNTILQNIAGSKGSLGWVGFSFAEAAGDQVKVLDISEEPGGRCVTPTAETISNGEYPLSRALYIYVNAERAERPAVSRFVEFFLDGLPEFVPAAGYVNLPEDQLEATTQRWQERRVGTREG